MRTISPMARAIVAFARNPGPNTPPSQLISRRERTGPLTTMSGHGPLVDCQAPRADRSRFTASHAASTTGKYSGLQPAMIAFAAAWATVMLRPRCGAVPMISSGSRAVVARNASTPERVAGTTGSPSVQPWS